MEIICDETKKIVEIWLTKAESADEALQSRLRPLCSQWNKKNYVHCVYRSGSRDLQEQTAALLLHNRELIARKEAEAAGMRLSPPDPAEKQPVPPA